MSAYESADLLLKLYEVRREPKMREAREWYARSFNPESLDDIKKTLSGPQSGHFRMVTSYWDMAASFVHNGAIDEQMFNDANGEQVVVLAKVEPFLNEYRAFMHNPSYLVHLERLVLKQPGARERMATLRERFRQMAAAVASGR